MVSELRSKHHLPWNVALEGLGNEDDFKQLIVVFYQVINYL